MEQVIKELLLQLNSSAIDRFPCFNDRPDIIQFRIGRNDGPQITFHPDSTDSFILYIRDEKDNDVRYSISIRDEEFSYCQEINSKIRRLCNDKGYIKTRDENLSIMLSTLIAAIKPIIDKKY